MKYFVKPGLSFKTSLDKSLSTKQMWHYALRDPLYLGVLFFLIGTLAFLVGVLLQ